MVGEVEELYSNLNKLLDDICKFLTDDANYEKLSPYARKQADELISRSKKQLQEIAKQSEDDNECGEAYVDMERKSDASNEEDQNNIYSSVEEATTMTVTTQAVVQPQSLPYSNLPAKDLSQDCKYGMLSWKCRIILKFEKIRKIYAGVHDNWLLIYSSEKDSKPLHTFDLNFHRAQPVVSKQKNPSQDFELISTLGEGKSYYFLAMTHKDMLQWTSHINRCHEKLKKSEKPSLSEEDISETYDMIPELTNPKVVESEDEEEIYHDINMYSPEVVDTPAKPPDLPARRCIKTNTPLPPIPGANNSDISNVSFTYDPVPSQASLESNSSFSADEEDDIYEEFVSKPPVVAPQINTVQNMKEKFKESFSRNVSSINRSGSIEKPKTPAKPKTFTEKTRHVILLKK